MIDDGVGERPTRTYLAIDLIDFFVGESACVHLLPSVHVCACPCSSLIITKLALAIQTRERKKERKKEREITIMFDVMLV